MRIISFLSLISLAFAGLILSSCDTNVDLIEEGKETSVLYGFLDPTIDTQFVKITKTFVTEGSAFDGAMDPALSEYQDLEAYVYALDENEDTINTFLLEEKTVTDKDSGAFYYPVQTVYYFTGSVNPDYEYEISFFASDHDVVSKAAVVGDFKNNITTSTSVINLVTSFNVSGSTYRNKFIKLTSVKNVKRYEFTFRYHYTEVYTDGTEKEKIISFKYPTLKTTSLNGGEEKDYVIDGEAFFQSVASKIISENNEDNVERRIIGTMDYIFEYAGKDFNTFIELNEPSTSINVEQNTYSNVTNAIGVWGSRGKTQFTEITFKRVFSNSYKEMAIGQFTTGLKFCSTDPGHAGDAWGCN
jgi:hypothetical protein